MSAFECWDRQWFALLVTGDLFPLGDHGDYEAADDPAARRQQLIDTFKGQLGALRAAEHFGIDTVID